MARWGSHGQVGVPWKVRSHDKIGIPWPGEDEPKLVGESSHERMRLPAAGGESSWLAESPHNKMRVPRERRGSNGPCSSVTILWSPWLCEDPHKVPMSSPTHGQDGGNLSGNQILGREEL